MAKNRRGMLIKNTNDRTVEIEMKTRDISLKSGEEKFITAEEVRDEALRAKLQVRAISIVRPSTEEEESVLMTELLEAARLQEEESLDQDLSESEEESPDNITT